MLSYMLPTDDKPPPGDTNQANYRASKLQKSPRERPPLASKPAIAVSPRNYSDTARTMIVSTKIEEHAGDQQPGLPPIESPKHNGTVTKKSTLHTSKVTKDDSLYSINSDTSTVGSDRKNKIFNGAKHTSLKRVSFGSSKGSMVETLVYETPVQEEPEINCFLDHNGRLPPLIASVPDTDEGREMVRVSLLGPQPSPTTPGVFQVQSIAISRTQPIDMDTVPAELLTTHTEHTAPAYHTQISTDSGWDNPFRPDGDLSREADEIVELIKGGKPITPTPGQTAPPLPGCETGGNAQTAIDHDSSSSPLLKSSANSTNRHANTSPKPGQENGKAHSTPIKSGTANSQQPVNDKVAAASRAATVEVARMTAQGPGDASQVEHVTLKKKPKCKCCVLQ
ncbi:uncharacterized protein LOC128895206 [Hylaeus anthracinus]|uniref:uncharacterized protein LOC128872301 n=1 Tax=Hylaeus volcanicus TaxID=313075 RepID=UPI0023B7AFDF|nr:uncharacterized protein LOC128872301 [Hylaeus volcanicus]XP_053970831.1 uncharacterized protein LOC128872301 [Hylaeus volcanicus]XP_054013592.1 uncharacterized protein LOC128895206 [Hylaeus anthracinus]XP_054013593.1 uncharacterized protein LOC128895206 [Hylaeus anthracinus]